MAKHIGITVPTELYERLQAVKDAFSISGVCQAALAREVTLQKLGQKGAKDMEGQIERLRQEKDQHDEEYEDMGREGGLSDAKELSYADFVEVERCLRACEDVVREGLEFEHGLSDFYGNSPLWHDQLEDTVREHEKLDSVFAPDLYVYGWLKGVAEAFDSIRDKL